MDKNVSINSNKVPKISGSNGISIMRVRGNAMANLKLLCNHPLGALFVAVLLGLSLTSCSNSGGNDGSVDEPAPDADAGGDPGVGDDGADAGGNPDIGDGDDEDSADSDADIEFAWIAVNAGEFDMGAPDDETCQVFDTVRRHVTLTHDFLIMATEVSQAQYVDLIGTNPSSFPACGLQCPVESVSWHDAAAYCNRLSEVNGLDTCYQCNDTGRFAICTEDHSYQQAEIYECPGYRLPTDAEWEYAYRAGSQTEFYNGDIGDPKNCGCTRINLLLDEIAWYCGNSAVSWEGCEDTTNCGCWDIDGNPDCGSDCAGPHPVGQKAPNAWQLFDMAGNVSEWCHDRTDSEPLSPDPVTNPVGLMGDMYRVYRGGAYHNAADSLRAAHRGGVIPGVWPYATGFRCVRSLGVK